MDLFKPPFSYPKYEALSRKGRKRYFLDRLGRANVVNEIPIGVTNAADTSRKLSAGVWGDCPFTTMRARPGEGVFIFDDFERLPFSLTTNAESCFGQWDAWIGTTGSIGDGIEEGGAAKFDNSGANKACTLSTRTGSFRFVGATTAYNLNPGRMWMEFRIAVGSIAASQHGVFIGFADHTGSAISSSDTTIVAANAVSLTTTKNLFGVFKTATDASPTGLLTADWSAVYQPAAGTAVYPTGLKTLMTTVSSAVMAAYAASTDKGHGTGYVKIGMTYDPTGNTKYRAAPATCPSGQTAGLLYKPVIQFYVNGVPAPAFLDKGILQAATFPLTSVYSPVICYQNLVGSTAPVYIDWVAFGQEASF